MANIQIECNHSQERVTHKILQEWLEGKGLPVSWETLVKTLRKTGLNELADQIKYNVCVNMTVVTH